MNRQQYRPGPAEKKARKHSARHRARLQTWQALREDAEAQAVQAEADYLYWIGRVSTFAQGLDSALQGGA